MNCLKNPIIATWVSFIFSIILVFVPQHPDRFRDQAFISFCFLWITWCSFICLRLKNFFIAPALIWSGVSSALVFAASATVYGDSISAFRGPAATSALWIATAVTVLSNINYDVRLLFFRIYEMIALVSSVLLITGKTGVLDNLALDASLIALVYPSILYRDEPLWTKGKTKIFGSMLIMLYLSRLILPPIALFMSKSATGVYALIAIIAGHCLFEIKAHKKLLNSTITFITISSICLFIGAIAQGPYELVSSTGRVPMWKLFWNWWQYNANWYTGMGNGTFEVWGPYVMKQVAGIKTGFFVYVHNEFLQIFFEQGLFGIFSCLLVYVVVLKSSFQRKSWFFIPLLVTGVISLSQSPLRIAVLGFYVCMIFREALCLEHREVEPLWQWK